MNFAKPSGGCRGVPNRLKNEQDDRRSGAADHP